MNTTITLNAFQAAVVDGLLRQAELNMSPEFSDWFAMMGLEEADDVELTDEQRDAFNMDVGEVVYKLRNRISALSIEGVAQAYAGIEEN
jgi:hypothetical protein